MSSVPIKIKQLDMKEARRPKGNDNAGFETSKAKSHMGEGWRGTTKGKTKHTYKAGD